MLLGVGEKIPRRRDRQKNNFYKNEDGAKAQEDSTTNNPTAKAVGNR